MSGKIQRHFLATAITCLFAAVCAGFIWFFTSQFTDASAAVRANASDSAGLGQVLSAARTEMLSWCFKAFVFTWLFIQLFIFMADRREPSAANEASAYQSTWFILMFLNFFVLAIISYFWVPFTEILARLAEGNYWILLAIINVFSLLAFWLATGLFVKSAMKRSVPFADLFAR
jgi:hypothetical protein